MDYKRCWAEVDLSALSHNYRCIRRYMTPGCRYLAIVKADGYGHGAATVATLLQKEGADWFGVATLEEALDLGWEILAECFEPNETGLKSSLIQERWPKSAAAE